MATDGMEPLEGGARSSGVISVASLESRMAEAMASAVLRQVAPALDHAEQAVGAMRARVTYGGGGGLVLLLVLVLWGWREYAAHERERVERDHDLAAKISEVAEAIDSTRSDAVERDQVIEDLRGHVARLSMAVNELSQVVWKSKAEPAANPYPDAVTAATRAR